MTEAQKAALWARRYRLDPRHIGLMWNLLLGPEAARELSESLTSRTTAELQDLCARMRSGQLSAEIAARPPYDRRPITASPRYARTRRPAAQRFNGRLAWDVSGNGRIDYDKLLGPKAARELGESLTGMKKAELQDLCARMRSGQLSAEIAARPFYAARLKAHTLQVA